MAAWPATTCPPVGNWVGTGLTAQALDASTTASTAERKLARSNEVPGPCDWVSSEATTHSWVASRQTMRYCLFTRPTPSQREGHTG